MKKFYYLMMAMLMAMTTLSLTACGDDDEDGPDGGGGDIVGAWKANMMNYADDIEDFEEIKEYCESFESLFQFKKDHKFVSVTVLKYKKSVAEEYKDVPGFENPEIDIERGTYSVSGDKLTLIYTDEDGTTDREEVNFKVKGKTLTITYIDEEDGKPRSIKFSGISEKEIENYLKGK